MSDSSEKLRQAFNEVSGTSAEFLSLFSSSFIGFCATVWATWVIYSSYKLVDNQNYKYADWGNDAIQTFILLVVFLVILAI